MRFGNVRIEIEQGDIAGQSDLEAVVNAANAELQMGGGVAGAIHSTAGPGLAEECRPQAPISPGEAVLTGAHNLPNRFVIHCLGPVYGRDEPSDTLLAGCYKNALQLAEENGIVSVGFPAISTGAFGYPIKEATDIALKTVRDVCRSLEKVGLVRFILFSDQDYRIYSEFLQIQSKG